MVVGAARPAHGPMPGSMTPASSGASHASAGYARHGFRVKFFLQKPRKQRGRYPAAISDPTQLRRLLDLVINRIQSVDWKLANLMNLGVTKFMPFFRLSNYSPAEQKGMKRLHPHEGGTLIRSGMARGIPLHAEKAIIVEFAWSTPYLGYLIAHGVSREPGTFVKFWPYVRATNLLQVGVKNVFRQMGTMVGSTVNLFSYVRQQSLGDF